MNNLKVKLDQLFEAVTKKNEDQARPKTADAVMDAETQQAFTFIEKAIFENVQAALHSKEFPSLLDDCFVENLRKALSFHPYFVYESWSARNDISEKELSAAEKDIRAGRIKKLESLRDIDRKQDFTMPLSDFYYRYMRLLNNLSYQFWVLAHEAKHFNSFVAAKHFLQAISLIHVRKTRVVPNFKAEDIDTLIEHMMDGIDELKIAMDYDQLKEWNSFCKKELATLSAVMTKSKNFEKRGKK